VEKKIDYNRLLRERDNNRALYELSVEAAKSGGLDRDAQGQQCSGA